MLPQETVKNKSTLLRSGKKKTTWVFFAPLAKISLPSLFLLQQREAKEIWQDDETCDHFTRFRRKMPISSIPPMQMKGSASQGHSVSGPQPFRISTLAPDSFCLSVHRDFPHALWYPLFRPHAQCARPPSLRDFIFTPRLQWRRTEKETQWGRRESLMYWNYILSSPSLFFFFRSPLRSPQFTIYTQKNHSTNPWQGQKKKSLERWRVT